MSRRERLSSEWESLGAWGAGEFFICPVLVVVPPPPLHGCSAFSSVEYQVLVLLWVWDGWIDCRSQLPDGFVSLWASSLRAPALL